MSDLQNLLMVGTWLSYSVDAFYTKNLSSIFWAHIVLLSLTFQQFIYGDKIFREYEPGQFEIGSAEQLHEYVQSNPAVGFTSWNNTNRPSTFILRFPNARIDESGLGAFVVWITTRGRAFFESTTDPSRGYFVSVTLIVTTYVFPGDKDRLSTTNWVDVNDDRVIYFRLRYSQMSAEFGVWLSSFTWKNDRFTTQLLLSDAFFVTSKQKLHRESSVLPCETKDVVLESFLIQRLRMIVERVQTTRWFVSPDDMISICFLHCFMDFFELPINEVHKLRL